jgi:hypothetical protein
MMWVPALAGRVATRIVNLLASGAPVALDAAPNVVWTITRSGGNKLRLTGARARLREGTSNGGARGRGM